MYLFQYRYIYFYREIISNRPISIQLFEVLFKYLGYYEIVAKLENIYFFKWRIVRLVLVSEQLNLTTEYQHIGDAECTAFGKYKILVIKPECLVKHYNTFSRMLETLPIGIISLLSANGQGPIRMISY